MVAVGWVGLGKLGGPCAATLAHHGEHIVVGYDIRGDNPGSYDWAGLPPITLVDSIEKVITETDNVVFVAVQTPHGSKYGGETPPPVLPREFEYAYLVDAVDAVCDAAHRLAKKITLVIVSTVLPGTFNRYVRPRLNRYITPVYHPFFIAMGTVVQDFLRPELTLFGVDRDDDERPVLDLYKPIHHVPTSVLTIDSAELAKVAYNAFIGSKIVFANTLMELCEHTGADVDEVTDTLSLATDRVVSPRYLRAGMGDGGACHPRDLIALSALAQRFDLSTDYLGYLAKARVAQTDWLANVIMHWRDLTGYRLVILGKSYKPDVALVDGSPALLLAHLLRDRYAVDDLWHIDRVVDDSPSARMEEQAAFAQPRVFFIGTQHEEYRHLNYPRGSVVIDPFGYVTTSSIITLVTPGRKQRPIERKNDAS